jgi:transcriptional regulator with XRE-family HTH domain
MPTPPTDKQKAAFGALLRRLRTEKKWTAAALAASASWGDTPRVTQQNISDWEAGKASPRSRQKVFALDQALGAGGALMGALGYTEADVVDGAKMPSTGELANRIEALEERFDTIEALIKARLGADR